MPIDARGERREPKRGTYAGLFLVALATLTYEIRYLCDEATCDQTVLASRTLTWEEMQNADGVAIVIQ